MEFCQLVAALPGRKSAIYTFERGHAARHPHAALHDDVLRVRNCPPRLGRETGDPRRDLCSQLLCLAGS